MVKETYEPEQTPGKPSRGRILRTALELATDGSHKCSVPSQIYD